MKNFMLKNVSLLMLFCLIFLTLTYFIISKFKSDVSLDIELKNNNEEIHNSNIIKNVNYTSKDTNGNEYIINAYQGEIDLNNSNIIFLTNVKALIKLRSKENVIITSDFGKYNTENYDTIFSKNVIIKYLDNKILGEYLDFSLNRNSMIISNNVIYTNTDNILKADVIEVNIETKDTNIFMYNTEQKVNIKSKN
jgi:lipopolysaccharide export system protein LptA